MLYNLVTSAIFNNVIYGARLFYIILIQSFKTDFTSEALMLFVSAIQRSTR